MKIGTCKFCRSDTISSVSRYFQLSAQKTLHSKRISKHSHVKTMVYGFLKPIPSPGNVLELSCRIEFN